ncbi:MAG: hypothetical protein H6553_08980 [Chitinophagales bacterium]|nr:hypothetical protein [Chitinophagales bacterium]
MKLFINTIVISTCFILLNACTFNDKKPTEEEMKKCLMQELDNKAKVLNFETQDGLNSTPDGVKTYDAIFNAEIKFISAYKDKFKPGDYYKIINGSVKYIKTEKGWKAKSYDWDNMTLENLNDKTNNNNVVDNDYDVYNDEITEATNAVEEAATAVDAPSYTATIEAFLNAESTRNFSKFENYFSPIVARYWNVKNIDHAELRKQYTDSWSKTNYGINALEYIKYISSNTYDAYITYEYQLKSNGTIKTVESIIRFVFDDNGKIKEVYGIES